MNGRLLTYESQPHGITWEWRPTSSFKRDIDIAWSMDCPQGYLTKDPWLYYIPLEVITMHQWIYNIFHISFLEVSDSSNSGVFSSNSGTSYLAASPPAATSLQRGPSHRLTVTSTAREGIDRILLKRPTIPGIANVLSSAMDGYGSCPMSIMSYIQQVLMYPQVNSRNIASLAIQCIPIYPNVSLKIAKDRN